MTNQIQNTSAIVIFFVSIFLFFIILTIIAEFDYKLIKKQSKEIDKYMQPLIDAKTLLTMGDYREAAKQKSLYLFFKRTFVLISIIICLIVFYSLYITFAFFGYQTDLGENVSAIKVWWMQTTFGVVPAYTKTTLGGMNLIYGFYVSEVYEKIPLIHRIVTIVMNIFSLIVLLMYLYQVQGFVARFIRIMTKKSVDVIPVMRNPADNNSDNSNNNETTNNNKQ